MALQFRTCRMCGESHALRRDGLMSIHETVDGERCTEPEPQRTTRFPRPPTPEAWERDKEREEAFDLAAERKSRKTSAAPRAPKFDRKIYAVGGVRTVSGGSPGGGKRR